MRITRKGQVTIPADIRRHLGLEIGSEITFVVDGATVRVVPGRGDEKRDGAELIARIRAFGKSARRTNDLTTDEIMEMTRGPFDDVDPR